MKPNFISATDVQRNGKAVFKSAEPLQVVMSNNHLTGSILNQEMTELLLESDIWQQIREELWESRDKTSTELIKDRRRGKSRDSISLAEFRSQNNV